jgi:putative hydrolase of HD superfamily
MENRRLEQPIRFIRAVDKLKTIERQALITDASRQENDAEHAWHLALMDLVPGEYAQEDAIMQLTGGSWLRTG